MNKQNQWWGYVHVNGSLQVKRFFDHQDIVEAEQSDFVRKAYGPFYALDRAHALEQMEDMIR